MNKFFKNEKLIGKVLIATLLVLAVVTRFWYFGQPKEIVFDEVYFARFSANYFSGEYYFDIHPPLAKLILAGSAKLFGHSPEVGFDFSSIGNKFTPESKTFFYFLRFVISIFGVLLPLAMYFLARQLSLDRWASFLVGLLVVFDNAFLVQSRYVLTDIFLLVFGVLGLAFFFKARKTKKSFWLYILTGIFLAASFSVKWTGLIFSGVAGLVYIYDIWQSKDKKDLLKKSIQIIIPAFILYVLVFAVHFKSLPFSGSGDIFMKPAFRASLVGTSENINGYIEPSGFWSKFIELNATMYSANAGLEATHPYSSSWYSWPLMERSIYYWNGEDSNEEVRNIYFLGNPAIWAISLLVMIFWLFWIVFKKNKEKHFQVAVILIGYFANLLAYILVSRIAFTYHYLPSLIFAFLGAGLFFQKYLKIKYTIPLLLIIISLFVFFSPLSYGTPLEEKSFENRVWIDSWR